MSPSAYETCCLLAFRAVQGVHSDDVRHYDFANPRATPEHTPTRAQRSDRAMRVAIAVIAVLVLAFFGYGAIESQTPDGKQRSLERAAIAACWDQQVAKSLTPGSARSLASVCETMEATYRAKWKRQP